MININSKFKLHSKVFLCTKHIKYGMSGYTLIELIAVAGIIMVFSTVVASMIIFSLRGATTAKVANIVGQNGNYAQSAITNILLSAKKIKAVGANSTSSCVTPPYTGEESIEIEQLDGNSTTINCIPGTSGYIQVETFNSAPIPSPITIDKSLVDRSEVRTSACSFSCTQADEFTPPLIQIKFTIEDKNGIFSEQKYKSTFNTSVSLRNFK